MHREICSSVPSINSLPANEKLRLGHRASTRGGRWRFLADVLC
jgi:hypothetical protein